VHLYFTEPGDRTGNPALDAARREQGIQEILFRTAELFAPFNVQVRRMYGFGSRDDSPNGNTTIFVGALESTVNAQGVKGQYAFTPNRPPITRPPSRSSGGTTTSPTATPSTTRCRPRPC
jgi:hypothetical protein